MYVQKRMCMNRDIFNCHSSPVTNHVCKFFPPNSGNISDRYSFAHKPLGIEYRNYATVDIKIEPSAVAVRAKLVGGRVRRRVRLRLLKSSPSRRKFADFNNLCLQNDYLAFQHFLPIVPYSTRTTNKNIIHIVVPLPSIIYAKSNVCKFCLFNNQNALDQQTTLIFRYTRKKASIPL
jgi:hypothetical protein